jgi:FHS family L-fucose permease-like MFS transporter
MVIMLGVYGLANVALMFLVFLGLGWISVVALILSFFFMSIMYPTHFALGIRGLGEGTKTGSSFLVTAIVGGALMPMLMGWLADHYSMRVGFLMPLACFLFIMLYGFNWPRLYAGNNPPPKGIWSAGHPPVFGSFSAENGGRKMTGSSVLSGWRPPVAGHRG